MLVLARRVNESIRIGDKVVVKVLAIQEGQVKLGIEAPESVEILRWEIYEQIVKSNQQAASSTKESVTEVAKRLPVQKKNCRRECNLFGQKNKINILSK